MRRALMTACAAVIALPCFAFAQEGPAPAQAQSDVPQRQAVGAGVAAVVNDHPISTFDVQQRVRLMMASSGTELDERALGQMQIKALRDLVEERLKLQEAGRYDLVVGEGDIDEELARIAATGGSDIDGLARNLAGQGIAVETLREKIRSEIAWERLVGGRYGDRVSITDGEVEDQLSDMRDATQVPQYRVAEICLPADDADQAREMQNVGMQMIDQMQRGVPFRAIAQEYSTCPSAARGGDLGWMRMEEFEPAVRDLIPQLGQGSVSLPLPTDGMIKMIAMQQKRDIAEAGEPAYEVVYAGASKSVGRDTAAAAFAKLPQTNGCRSDTLSEDLGPGIGITVLPMLPAAAFGPQFRGELGTLERGDVSDVMESDGAYHAVLLCQKDEGLGLPSRSQIRARLRAEQLDRLGRRYLRDVERDGAVDVRIGQNPGGDAQADPNRG